MKLKPKPSIQQVDNFFPDNIQIEIAEWIRNAKYRHGETDDTKHPPTGLVCDLYHIAVSYTHLTLPTSDLV